MRERKKLETLVTPLRWQPSRSRRGSEVLLREDEVDDAVWTAPFHLINHVRHTIRLQVLKVNLSIRV